VRLYGELAAWWPLFSQPSDDAEEAAYFHRVLDGLATPPPRTVLELGSGGRDNASHLKAWYELTLVDVASGMLEASRAINPQCEHVEGDMRTVRLGKTFDGASSKVERANPRPRQGSTAAAAHRIASRSSDRG